jgi:uncharacterized protein YbjT (DUF2867 family)
MKMIALLGATGGTGMEVLRQGVEMGYKFKILCRSDPVGIPEKNVEVVKGDVLHKENIETVIKGCSVCVVSVGKGTVCSESQPLINAACEKFKVKKLIVVSSLGVGESYQDMDWVTWIFVNTVIARPIADKNLQEAEIKKLKGVDWTIVRPGGLSNSALTGKYRAQERGIGGGFIPRADVAHFILHECVQGSKWINKGVSLVS